MVMVTSLLHSVIERIHFTEQHKQPFLSSSHSSYNSPSSPTASDFSIALPDGASRDHNHFLITNLPQTHSESLLSFCGVVPLTRNLVELFYQLLRPAAYITVIGALNSYLKSR